MLKCVNLLSALGGEHSLQPEEVVGLLAKEELLSGYCVKNKTQGEDKWLS